MAAVLHKWVELKSCNLYVQCKVLEIVLCTSNFEKTLSCKEMMMMVFYFHKTSVLTRVIVRKLFFSLLWQPISGKKVGQAFVLGMYYQSLKYTV